jgi:hypothetical protein
VKGYAKFFPIILVVLFVASIYSVASEGQKVQDNYKQLLEDARGYAKDGILIDSINSYNDALQINDSLPIRIEAGEMLLDLGDRTTAIDWGKDTALKYPYEPNAYDFLLTIYYTTEDYAGFFKELDTMNGRNVQSKTVNKMLKKVKYTYFLDSDYDDASLFSEGLCAVAKKEDWGYVLENGKKTIGTQFKAAGAFVNDLAPATTESNDVFLIDSNGDNKKIVARNLAAKQFGLLVNDILPVFDGTLWSYYSTDGKRLHGGYEKASAYSAEGIAAVCEDDSWGFVNREGNYISNKRFENVATNELGVAFNQDCACAVLDDAVVILDSTGKVLTTTNYDDARPFGSDGLAAVCRAGLWGFMDADGKSVIEVQYEDARSFENGFAAVKVSGNWGFIDLKGTQVIKPVFSDAKDFSSSGSVYVSEDDKWALLKLFAQHHG